MFICPTSEHPQGLENVKVLCLDVSSQVHSHGNYGGPPKRLEQFMTEIPKPGYK